MGRESFLEKPDRAESPVQVVTLRFRRCGRGTPSRSVWSCSSRGLRRHHRVGERPFKTLPNACTAGS